MKAFQNENRDLDLREEKLSSDFDSRAEKNGKSSCGGDKVDLALLLGVESWVENFGYVLGNGIWESSSSGLLELLHGIGLGNLARWVLLVEEVPLFSNPRFIDYILILL